MNDKPIPLESVNPGPEMCKLKSVNKENSLEEMFWVGFDRAGGEISDRMVEALGSRLTVLLANEKFREHLSKAPILGHWRQLVVGTFTVGQWNRRDLGNESRAAVFGNGARYTWNVQVIVNGVETGSNGTCRTRVEAMKEADDALIRLGAFPLGGIPDEAREANENPPDDRNAYTDQPMRAPDDPRRGLESDDAADSLAYAREVIERSLRGTVSGRTSVEFSAGGGGAAVDSIDVDLSRNGRSGEFIPLDLREIRPRGRPLRRIYSRHSWDNNVCTRCGLERRASGPRNYEYIRMLGSRIASRGRTAGQCEPAAWIPIPTTFQEPDPENP